MNQQFTESNLRSLFEAMQFRASSFAAHIAKVNSNEPNPSNPIYLRFDIDDDPAKAYRMSLILNEYGIKGTFFILNTTKYWNEQPLLRWTSPLDESNLYEPFWQALQYMQSKGHEIGWHNNVLTEWIKQQQILGDFPKENPGSNWIFNAIQSIMNQFHSRGIAIRGSASHGDPLCRKLNYLNYEVFKECPRTSEAIGFPPCAFDIPRLSMADFGLEYETYHVPYDLYLSESGGRGWTKRAPSNASMKQATPWDGDLAIINRYDRIQILIHPQHWKI